jgi:hypothetical protein
MQAIIDVPSMLSMNFSSRCADIAAEEPAPSLLVRCGAKPMLKTELSWRRVS